MSTRPRCGVERAFRSTWLPPGVGLRNQGRLHALEAVFEPSKVRVRVFKLTPLHSAGGKFTTSSALGVAVWIGVSAESL